MVEALENALLLPPLSPDHWCNNQGQHLPLQWGIEFNRSVPQEAATHWIPSALRFKEMPRETNTSCCETPWGVSCLRPGNNPSKQRWGLNQVGTEEQHPLPAPFSLNALPDWLSCSLGHPTPTPATPGRHHPPSLLTTPSQGFQFYRKS